MWSEVLERFEQYAPVGVMARVALEQTLTSAAGITHWITENAKNTRTLLKRIGSWHELAAPLQQQITELPRQAHKRGDHDAGGGFDAKPLLPICCDTRNKKPVKQ